MPSYAFMSCVYAPEKISESCGFPTFPQWIIVRELCEMLKQDRIESAV